MRADEHGIRAGRGGCRGAERSEGVVSAPSPPALSNHVDELTSVVRRPREIVLRHRVQYAALRGMLAAFARLGFRRASGIGARVARWGYSPLGIRRDVVERQIAAAFPEWDETRVRRTALAAYENL